MPARAFAEQVIHAVSRIARAGWIRPSVDHRVVVVALGEGGARGGDLRGGARPVHVIEPVSNRFLVEEVQDIEFEAEAFPSTQVDLMRYKQIGGRQDRCPAHVPPSVDHYLDTIERRHVGAEGRAAGRVEISADLGTTWQDG